MLIIHQGSCVCNSAVWTATLDECWAESIESIPPKQGILIVIVQGRPKMRRKWLSLLPICWLPKFDITLSSCFLLPVLFFLLGHSSGTRSAMAWQMGRSSSSAIVWAGWLEWPGRKTAQTVRNRICSVLSNLGNQQMERSDSHICLVLGSPCPKAATRYSWLGHAGFLTLDIYKNPITSSIIEHLSLEFVRWHLSIPNFAASCKG